MKESKFTYASVGIAATILANGNLSAGSRISYPNKLSIQNFSCLQQAYTMIKWYENYWRFIICNGGS